MKMLYLVIRYIREAPPPPSPVILFECLTPSVPGELNDREDVEVEEVLIHLNAVLGIRIRMFMGILQDPDPDP
jgi:hypothetical protein